MDAPAPGMTKEEWIAHKVPILLKDGTAKDENQAVAIANSMWEEMQKAHMARMPIFPAKPCKSVDGRNVTQDHIDAILAYDASIRPAILKLDASNAHGSANGPALATIERTYADGAWIYGDLSAQSGYAEILPTLAGKSGPYPFRSIELDTLELNGEKRLYLESVALCGAQRPALDLPPAEFTKKQTYTICLTGGEHMPEAITPESDGKSEPIDFVKFKTDLEAEYQARIAAKEAEFAIREEAEVKARLKTEQTLAKEKLTQWVNSREMLTKIRGDQRDNVIAIAMELKNLNTKVTFSKKEMNISDAFQSLMEGLPDFISPRELSAYLPKDIPVEDRVPDDPQERETFQLRKLNEYAKEKNIDLAVLSEFTKAESQLKKLHPEYFTGVK